MRCLEQVFFQISRQLQDAVFLRTRWGFAKWYWHPSQAIQPAAEVNFSVRATQDLLKFCSCSVYYYREEWSILLWTLYAPALDPLWGSRLRRKNEFDPQLAVPVLNNIKISSAIPMGISCSSKINFDGSILITIENSKPSWNKFDVSWQNIYSRKKHSLLFWKTTRPCKKWRWILSFVEHYPFSVGSLATFELEKPHCLVESQRRDEGSDFVRRQWGEKSFLRLLHDSEPAWSKVQCHRQFCRARNRQCM